MASASARARVMFMVMIMNMLLFRARVRARVSCGAQPSTGKHRRLYDRRRLYGTTIHTNCQKNIHKLAYSRPGVHIQSEPYRDNSMIGVVLKHWVYLYVVATMGVLFQVWWCKRGSAGGNTREARRSLRADLEAISAILSRKFMSQLTQLQQVRANSCLSEFVCCGANL